MLDARLLMSPIKIIDKWGFVEYDTLRLGMYSSARGLPQSPCGDSSLEREPFGRILFGNTDLGGD